MDFLDRILWELAYQKRLLTCLSSVQEDQFFGFGKTSFLKGWPHHTIERLILFLGFTKSIIKMGSFHTIELHFVLLLVLPVRMRLGVDVVFIWCNIDILRIVHRMLVWTVSVCKGELSTFYLVPHLEDCSPHVSVNWEFMFWELHPHNFLFACLNLNIWTCHKGKSHCAMNHLFVGSCPPEGQGLLHWIQLLEVLLY